MLHSLLLYLSGAVRYMTVCVCVCFWCIQPQHDSVKALLNCEDNEGCTPLHYACRLGIHDTVKNMLGLSGKDSLSCKSKDKKSALHFAAQ